MSEYRRFVAYVYEYPEGKKGDGKGFIKVEVRDGICRMQFRLSGIYSQETLPCKIYGYIKEGDEYHGILLGDCDLAGEIIAFSLELSADNVAESGSSIDDFKGMVFLAGDVKYGTGWDENPVPFDKIRLEKREKEEPEMREPEQPESEELNPEELNPEEPGTEEVEPEIEMQEQEEQFPPTPDILQDVGEETEELEENVEETEEFCCPFKDGEFEECQKIGILDYEKLNPCDQGLLNNNFLRYGWRRYKHVLIGRDTKRNCYILGVPGMYDRQEALMAGMFGFPYFKEAKPEKTELSAQEVQGHFGYWYRSINPPDRDRGNRL